MKNDSDIFIISIIFKRSSCSDLKKYTNLVAFFHYYKLYQPTFVPREGSFGASNGKNQTDPKATNSAGDS